MFLSFGACTFVQIWISIQTRQYKEIKILRQGYCYHNLRKAFSKFHRRHFDRVSKYIVGLKTLLLQSLSEPEFYGNLVYKFRKIIGKNDFSLSFQKDNCS